MGAVSDALREVLAAPTDGRGIVPAVLVLFLLGDQGPRDRGCVLA